MSSARAHPQRQPWHRLPAWLRPRAREAPGSGQLRLAETTLLLFAALLLAVATINDVVRQTHINHRLVADLRTWRSHSARQYRNLTVEQEVFGLTSSREVVCGNTSPGAPKAKVQLCLVMGGPVLDGQRAVQGGWYLPPKAEDRPTTRYGCFGPAAQGRCAR